MSLTDWLGTAGVLLILGTYLLLQLGRVDPAAPHFSTANAVGSGLILVSLSVNFNLPAALIEAAWLLISVFGLCRSLLRRRRLD